MANRLRTIYWEMTQLINTTASRYSFNRCVPGILSEIAGDIKNRRILDVGCGIGKYSKLFAGNQYIGIDVGDYQFEKNLIEDSSFCRANVEDIPFKDNTFDIIFSSFMIEHVESADKALLSVYRALKQGGWFLSSTGTKWARPMGEMHKLFWKEDDDSVGQAHHYFEIDELRNLYDKAGFEDIDIRYVGGPLATSIELVITFFRLLTMKIKGQTYTHGRNSDETGNKAIKKKSMFSRILGAVWVLLQFPVRWTLYEISFWFDLVLSNLGGARFVVVTASRRDIVRQ
jgi:ubiquinone/menaquinone biosynthesis C-methylase UbiE